MTEECELVSARRKFTKTFLAVKAVTSLALSFEQWTCGGASDERKAHPMDSVDFGSLFLFFSSDSKDQILFEIE